MQRKKVTYICGKCRHELHDEVRVAGIYNYICSFCSRQGNNVTWSTEYLILNDLLVYEKLENYSDALRDWLTI